jgi:hypothetical protein
MLTTSSTNLREINLRDVVCCDSLRACANAAADGSRAITSKMNGGPDFSFMQVADTCCVGFGDTGVKARMRVLLIVSLRYG